MTSKDWFWQIYCGSAIYCRKNKTEVYKAWITTSTYKVKKNIPTVLEKNKYNFSVCNNRPHLVNSIPCGACAIIE